MTSKHLSRAAILAVISLPLIGAFLHQRRQTIRAANSSSRSSIWPRHAMSTPSTQTHCTGSPPKASSGNYTTLSPASTPGPSSPSSTTRCGAITSGWAFRSQLARRGSSYNTSSPIPRHPKTAELMATKITQVDTFGTLGWTAQEISDKPTEHPAHPSPSHCFGLAFHSRSLWHSRDQSSTSRTVPYTFLIDGTIGYIPLLQFGERASLELANAVADVTQQRRNESSSSISRRSRRSTPTGR